jgi:hypothetical protein
MPTFSEPSDLRYGELFFHVFAHVTETRALPASVFSERYVAWCQGVLGDARERTLADDARLLAREFPSHAALAAVQSLAKLYRTTEGLSRAGTRSLAELADEDVDDPRILVHLRGLGAGAELAFCALLLELPSFVRLAAPPAVPLAFRERVASLVALAPGLERAQIGCVRSLDLRGRAWGDEIWVGHPAAEIAPSIEHAAWQAAHEATVVAVSREQPALGERAVEAVAVERLTLLAEAAGERAGHAEWQRGLEEVSGVRRRASV